MTLNFYGMGFALIFLAIGLAEVYVYGRAIYPVLSHRHELAKVTYSHGRSPAFVSTIIHLQALIVLPLLGYFVGSQFFSPGAN
jgi:hypothetical protein